MAGALRFSHDVVSAVVAAARKKPTRFSIKSATTCVLRCVSHDSVLYVGVVRAPFARTAVHDHCVARSAPRKRAVRRSDRKSAFFFSAVSVAYLLEGAVQGRNLRERRCLLYVWCVV